MTYIHTLLALINTIILRAGLFEHSFL